MSTPYVKAGLSELRVPEIDTGTPAAETEFDPIKAAIRFVDGKPTHDDIEWMGRAFAACLMDLGAVPLERCLHLPTTPAAWRDGNRDRWLCKAAALLGTKGVSVGAKKLEAEWNRFITTLWPQWRDDVEPPDYATPLSVALFWATRSNRSQGLGARQLRRIAGHIFLAKSP